MALLLAVLTAVCLLGDAASAAAPSKVTVSVVGFAECLDCADSKGSPTTVDAFKDIHVEVLCKASDGKWVKKGSSPFSSGGELAVPVANDILGVDGGLKTECIAQLSASSRAAPCPVLANKGPEHFRVVHHSKDEAAGRVVLAISSEKLTFSRAPCSAAFWLPLPWPHPWFKPCPPPYQPSPMPPPPTPPSPSPPTPSPSPPTPMPSPSPPTPSPSPPTPMPSPSPPLTPPNIHPSPPRERSPSPTYRYSSPPPPAVKPPVKKPCPPVHKPKPPPPPPPKKKPCPPVHKPKPPPPPPPKKKPCPPSPPPPYKPYGKSGPLS